MHSWQMAFIHPAAGVLSFIWAMAWLVFFGKTPSRIRKKLTTEERDYIIGGQESHHQTNNSKKMSPWQILRNRRSGVSRCRALPSQHGDLQLDPAVHV